MSAGSDERSSAGEAPGGAAGSSETAGGATGTGVAARSSESGGGAAGTGVAARSSESGGGAAGTGVAARSSETAGGAAGTGVAARSSESGGGAAGTGVAVVSGGGSGLGREIALELAQRGYALALLGRHAAPLAATLAAAGLGPDRGLALPCDVRDPAAVGEAVRAVHERFGAAEIVVPAAGQVRLGPLAEISPAEFADTVAVNLTGVFVLLRALLPEMLRRGRGWIFVILSVAARRAFPAWGAYAASKWGLAGLVASLREELAGTGIRLTALYPGAADTPIWEGLPGSWDRAAMLPAREAARAVGYALDADPRALVEELHLGPAGGAL